MDKKIQEARKFWNGGRGQLLQAQALYFYSKNAPESSDRDDIAWILETLFPQMLDMFVTEDKVKEELQDEG